ncbi:MAG: phosphate-starvation-inducible PsiE family protein [Nitrosomonadaceae bacterium]|nr:phosphate-starvation-inducible PsiE family protein [Nitrosomonadaceae bacterium]
MHASRKSAQTKTKGPEQSKLPSRLIIETFGNQMVDIFILVALFVLGATIVWSAVYAYLDMMSKSHGTIEDILLLFIYLELGAMVGIYFKSGIIPAQFLIYIAITVLTRMLASVTVVEMSDARILIVVGAIVLLCIAVLILRYADKQYGEREDKSWLA